MRTNAAAAAAAATLTLAVAILAGCSEETPAPPGPPPQRPTIAPATAERGDASLPLVRYYSLPG